MFRFIRKLWGKLFGTRYREVDITNIDSTRPPQWLTESNPRWASAPTKREPVLRSPRAGRASARTDAPLDDDGFVMSAAVAAATDNPALGFAAGGNLSGALLGTSIAISSNAVAETASSPDPEHCTSSYDPTPSSDYSSSSSSSYDSGSSSSSYDSGSSSSSCDSSSF